MNRCLSAYELPPTRISSTVCGQVNGRELAIPHRAKPTWRLRDSSLAMPALTPGQVDRLFRVSKLFRNEWDERHGEKTYGERTIAKAMEEASASGAPQEDQLLHELNQRFGVVPVGNSVRILEDCPKTLTTGLGYRLYAVSDFTMLLQSKRTPDGKGSLSRWWLSHPQRRDFDEIVFEPGANRPKAYNTWRGFPVKPAAGRATLWWDFVRDDICNGDAELYAYVRRWLAHMIQHPDELPEVSLVLRGGQGTGKNTFADTVGKLVEPHYASVNRMDQVTGRFNAHLQSTLLIHANEAMWGGIKADAGALKALITDGTISIEGKGRDIVRLSNYARVIVSSNEQWAVPVDMDDRRFLPLDVSKAHQQDSAHFAAIHAELSNGGLQAIMHDLQQENLADFHPRNKPVSRYGADLKIKTANSVVRWWYESLKAGHIQPSTANEVTQNYPKLHWPRTIGKIELYGCYIAWCRENNERHPEANSDFFKKLKDMLPEGEFGYRPSGGGTMRMRQVKMPSLSRSRTQFGKALRLYGKAHWKKQ